MFISTLLIASLVICVSSHSWPDHSVNSSSKRQTPSSGDFPPGCSSQCQTTENAIANCTDDSCFCTAANMDSLKTCYQCIGDLINNVADIQISLNEVTSNCTAEGFKVPSETLTGGGSSPSATTGNSSNPSSIGGSPSTITSVGMLGSGFAALLIAFGIGML